MRAKSILLLLLALGCGLIASIGITQVMAKRGAESVPGETETIFVATKEISMGDPLTAQMVKVEPWPKDKIPAGAFVSPATRVEDLEGRRPKAPIPAGAPILEKQLLGKGVSEGASGIVPVGMRVAAVKVDPVIGASSMFRPSDRVDVLIHVKQDESRGVPQTVARTILQDIKVFAVNDQYDVSAASGEKAIAAKTIWLLVSPEQAETLTLAGELGQIRLIMRSPSDNEQKKLQGQSMRNMLDGLPPASPDSTRSPLVKGEGNLQKSASTQLMEMIGAKSAEKGKKEKPAPASTLAVVPPPAPKNTWTMRIVAGAQVADTLLEESQAPSGDGNPSRWRVNGTTQWSGTSPAAGPSAAAARAWDASENRRPVGDDLRKMKGNTQDKVPDKGKDDLRRDERA